MPSVGRVPCGWGTGGQWVGECWAGSCAQRPACPLPLFVASCPVVVGSVVAVYGGWHCSVGERADFKE